MPLPDTAQAFEWDSLWLRDDQRAKREFDAGNSEAAAELFKDPAWKSAAQYRAGDFQATADSLEQTEDIEGQYNRGNALARLGQYEEAIANYDKVLEQMPEHEDAKFNKELLEDELEKQQQQQQDQQQQSSDDQEKKEGEQEDQQQQEGEDGEQQEGENSQSQDQQQEQQNKEQQQSDGQQDDKEMTPEEKQQQEAEQAEAEKSEQEKKEAEQQKAEQKEAEDQSEEKQEQLAQAKQEELDEEQKQATEQWLRRIPDDPAGLLRRKFRYQYQQRQGQKSTEDKTW